MCMHARTSVGCSLHTSTSCLYARCDNKFFMSRDLFVRLRFVLFHSFFCSLSSVHSILLTLALCAFFSSRSFCPFVCLFRCFSMCLHEGDKVFNPLHVERFRSLFSKSLTSFAESAFFTCSLCSVFVIFHNLIVSLDVVCLRSALFLNIGKTVIGKLVSSTSSNHCHRHYCCWCWHPFKNSWTR